LFYGNHLLTHATAGGWTPRTQRKQIILALCSNHDVGYRNASWLLAIPSFTPSSAEVKERVELYLYSPSVPSGCNGAQTSFFHALTLATYSI
jgi:hypothetical protein